MSVDVSTSIVIRRPREQVSTYATDADNAPEWYVNIESVEFGKCDDVHPDKAKKCIA